MNDAVCMTCMQALCTIHTVFVILVHRIGPWFTGYFVTVSDEVAGLPATALYACWL
jgi:hypothetical protein